MLLKRIINCQIVIIFWIGALNSCSRTKQVNVLQKSTEIFNQFHEQILNDIFDFKILDGQIIAFDTLSISKNQMHLDFLTYIEDDVDDEWPLELTSSLADNFSINKSVIDLKKLESPFRIEANPNVINNLDSTFRDKYFGIIRLSNFSYDESFEEVVFYLVVFCGNDCSKGILINAKIIDGNWSLRSIAEIWRG